MMKEALQRGLVGNAVAVSCPNPSAVDNATMSNSAEVDESELRRKRMRLDMVNKLRSEMNYGHVTDSMVCKQCYCQ